ncbi:hypothetical protein NBH19_22520 [Rhizobium sp. S95]|uniref:Uncharacterized protein n=1 Tax=Ciceribacter sichuanensis TaxID=2949647 RepID=A0AAJ1BV55_9HYPH|nr:MULTISPECIES: hypothetical protein [unclassified Ciceribacter]MCM2398859.1 hypothetical protein [Ciceribacter sp. S95]MCO5956935.1 hypothetical protein [Ciceribacter sp. S101]
MKQASGHGVARMIRCRLKSGSGGSRGDGKGHPAWHEPLLQATALAHGRAHKRYRDALRSRENETKYHRERSFYGRRKEFFRSGGIQSDWAHPRLEEGVARHGVLSNQQMKPATCWPAYT